MDTDIMDTDEPHQTGPFAHSVVFYRGTRDYLARLVPFLLDGQAAGEPAAVVVPGPNLDAIRDEFAARGGDIDRVRWLDMINAGRNPGRIIPAVLRAFVDQHDGQRVWIIGEPIWRGRSPLEYPACVQHEALVNTVFRGRPVTILCPYDARQLAPVALADALATHPIVVDEQGERPSDAFEPDRVVSRYNQPLDTLTAPYRFSVTAAELAMVRQWAIDLAGDLGFDGDRLADVVFVANELVSNGLEHGESEVELLAWTEDSALVLQASNAGTMTDPLAGRIPAAPGQCRGRGLLTVNLVADLVRMYTDPHATTVRVYFRVPVPRPTLPGT